MARRWQVVFLISAGVFLVLALIAGWGGVLPFERGLYEGIVAGVPPAVVAAFWWINHLGSKWVLLPATGALIITLPRMLRRRWWLWLAVMLVAPALEGLTKQLVGRPRPEGLGMGFPSGHVTAVAAFFVMAAYLGQTALGGRSVKRWLWGVAALAVIVVAFARVVLRAHWPLDAVGGVALGIACAAAAAWWNEHHP